MAIPNPFITGYGKIWDALEAHTPLTDIVKVGNRNKLDQAQPERLKPSLQPADLPELGVVPIGFEFDVFATSTSATATKALAITMKAGDLRVQEELFILQWEVARAFGIAGVKLGLSVIERWTLTDGAEERQAFAETKGSQGWFSVATLTLFYRFAQTDITT